jgi:hypothetical protein
VDLIGQDAELDSDLWPNVELVTVALTPSVVVFVGIAGAN